MSSVNEVSRPTVHIKLKPKGRKRFEFLTSKGGLNHLRIHAAMFTRERAEKLVAEIRAENDDEYEVKIEGILKESDGIQE